MKFEALERSGLLGAMSDIAREIVLPQGIFYWSGRAKKEAEIDATIGSAQGKTSLFLPKGDDTVRTFYLPSVVERLSALDPEQVVPYAPINGAPKFRAAWRKWIVEKLSEQYEFDQNLISNPITVPGVTAAIAFLSRLFLSPGRTIICHDLKWENYHPILEDSQQLEIATFPLFREGGFDTGSFLSLVGEMLKKQDVTAILNFPNNPTGFMPTIRDAEDMRKGLIEAAEKTGNKIILIFDDAYDGFVYDKDAAGISIFGKFVGAHPRIVPIKCDGASKEFLLYGGRIASITFGFHPSWGDPEQLQKELDNKIGAFIRGSISNCNHGAQIAIAGAIEDGGIAKKERAVIVGILEKRYSALKKALAAADIPGATPLPFNSGFFAFVNVKVEAEKLADHLLKKYKLGIIPHTDAENNINGIRIAFCSVDESLIAETVGRIEAGVKDLS
ncbi:MAG TPA: aminotransferase class I/II-fold pyridoxal phosphate-dependent enzyme [bacterium]|nr:aminotransferase class I/II-fold pyridoxal phosphate-dependent enzyme [bacterium]